MKFPRLAASIVVPPIEMTRHVLCRIMCTVGAAQPETGGILLGPVGTDRITDFYLDVTARCTGATYSPDHITLRRKMAEEWLPNGIDMKGFVHSHPGSLDRLSEGDLAYIGRLLEKNPDMDLFIAPIVIPYQFRIRPLVVLRDDPERGRETELHFFEADTKFVAPKCAKELK